MIRLIRLIDCVHCIFTHTGTHTQNFMIYKREQWTGKDCFALKWWQTALAWETQGKNKCSPLCSAHILLSQSGFINYDITLYDSVTLGHIKLYCTVSLWIPEQTFVHHIQPLSTVRITSFLFSVHLSEREAKSFNEMSISSTLVNKWIVLRGFVCTESIQHVGKWHQLAWGA